MTITLTITTLASIGTAVNAADVTGPDNQLLTHLNNILNASQSAERLRFAQIATPAAPAGGTDALYFKSDDVLYREKSDGTEMPIGPFPAQTCNGRLTLTTGLPVTTADVTAATTLYFTPYKGNRIALYNGSTWDLYSFTEKSISLALLTASLPHDVYGYISAGALTLELVAWTNTTTRATAIVLQDGVYCKTGTLTKRYLGTICTTSTIGQCEDSILRRLVWNMDNRVLRRFAVKDTTDSWTYATNTWRSWNNSTANRVEFVRGVSEDPVCLRFAASGLQAGGVSGAVGIGLGVTNANNAFTNQQMATTTQMNASATYNDLPAAGYNFLQLVEIASGATVTFFGDGGVATLQNGAVGEIAA